ncbi:MAG: hypothetical protein V3V98_09920 [Thermoplasmata archaeon]
MPKKKPTSEAKELVLTRAYKKKLLEAILSFEKQVDEELSDFVNEDVRSIEDKLSNLDDSAVALLEEAEAVSEAKMKEEEFTSKLDDVKKASGKLVKLAEGCERFDVSGVGDVDDEESEHASLRERIEKDKIPGTSELVVEIERLVGQLAEKLEEIEQKTSEIDDHLRSRTERMKALIDRSLKAKLLRKGPYSRITKTLEPLRDKSCGKVIKGLEGIRHTYQQELKLKLSDDEVVIWEAALDVLDEEDDQLLERDVLAGRLKLLKRIGTGELERRNTYSPAEISETLSGLAEKNALAVYMGT